MTEVREMRTLCPGCGGGRRRRFHGVPALRPAAERRLPEVRPRAAAGLEVLSVLRDERHAAKPTKKQLRDQRQDAASCRRRTSLNSRTSSR